MLTVDFPYFFLSPASTKKQEKRYFDLLLILNFKNSLLKMCTKFHFNQLNGSRDIVVDNLKNEIIKLLLFSR